MAQNQSAGDTVEAVRALVDQLMTLVQTQINAKLDAITEAIQTRITARLDEIAAAVADLQVRVDEIQADLASEETEEPVPPPTPPAPPPA